MIKDIFAANLSESLEVLDRHTQEHLENLLNETEEDQTPQGKKAPETSIYGICGLKFPINITPVTLSDKTKFPEVVMLLDIFC